MIRHLIKLIWNKKRSNFLLTMEIFASFIVLFGVMSLVFYNYSNYAEPLGYEYENVWGIYFSKQQLSDSLFREALVRAKRQVASRGEVLDVSHCSFNTPFAMSSMGWGIQAGDRSTYADVVAADENYPRVLGMELPEGRWFEPGEVAGGQRVVVLSRKAREMLFGDEPAVGKTINMDSQEAWRVVGVTGNFKIQSEFQEPGAVVFINHRAPGFTADVLLARVKPGADAEFEAALLKELNGIARGANIELSYLTDQRRNQHNLVRIPILIASIVSGFLLINVGLGLFGVLWFNIRKRRDEIGLRRALGATGSGIMRHFVGEALVIAAFGVLVGIFFAVQLPLLNVFNLDKSVYVQAIVASIAILTLLVAACALFPSREAARVLPAAVLHEE